jgi:hypothetical protein
MRGDRRSVGTHPGVRLAASTYERAQNTGR